MRILNKRILKIGFTAMALSQIKQKLQNNINLSPSYGLLIKVMQNMMVASGIKPSVGDIVKIFSYEHSVRSLGMVTAIEGEKIFYQPFFIYRRTQMRG